MPILLSWKTARNRVKGLRRTHPQPCLEVLEGRALLSSLPTPTNAAAAVGSSATSSPQSATVGSILPDRTLPEWMQTYMTWWLGAGRANGKDPGRVGNVQLLPLPEGNDVKLVQGDGTYGDPAVLEGHKEVRLEPNTYFVLPVITWIGEKYTGHGGAGYPDDPPLPSSTMGVNGDLGVPSPKVTLDGQPLIDSTNVQQYYYDPATLHITYSKPSPYGSTGAIFTQGVGIVHSPLSEGSHTLTVDSWTMAPPDSSYLNPHLYPEGIGVHYINTWTITVAP